jgi:hypothetical protein
MQGLLRKLWRAIQNFFTQLLGGQSVTGRVKVMETIPLTDTDYEFLYMQLLDGVAHGWHEGRILIFFEKLGDRGRQKDWVEWLERFGARLQSSASLNQLLATRMIRLGELARAFPGIERIGETSYEIGYQLYTKETATLIWEYAGEDEAPGSYSLPQPPENLLDSGETSDFNGTDPENPQLETLTLDELFNRLQNDPILAGQMAEQLGVESKDAESIIDSLIAQFSPQEGKIPETAEDWFNQGLEQANLGNWSNAIADWEQALSLNPQLASAWHNRGSALAMIGNYEEALNSYDRALEITPNDYQVINARGSALYGLQRWQEALECWDQVLAADDNFYQAWYNRGSTLENLGETAAAIACYQKALAIAPDFELAQTRLEALLGQKPPEDDGNPPA